MKKLIIVLSIIVTSITIYTINHNHENNDFDYKQYYRYCKENTKNIKKLLKTVIKKQKYIGYTEARYQMFTYIDNYNGYVNSIYSNENFYCNGIPNPNKFNCEHTIPQSKFSNNEKNFQKTDLHHLRPCNSRINSIRGNYPYGIVKVVQKSFNGSLYGLNSEGKKVFEPRDEIKGNIARGIFYFSLRYDWKIDDKYEKLLRKWHNEDLVTEKEFNRNSRIEDIQENRNPFIDHPEFVDYIKDF
ncbi:MAG: endonuclease I family protein [Nanoarchaeota archaeon]